MSSDSVPLSTEADQLLRSGLQLRCPECSQELDLTSLRCAHGHSFAFEAQVLTLMSAQFGTRLHAYQHGLAQFRGHTERRLLDATAYEQLPYGPATEKKPEWRVRHYDWQLLQKLLVGMSPQRILDVGAWNGWLSHRLAKLGHNVTAVGYFTDVFDGLRARKHYQRPTWLAIQMDIEDLSLFESSFDLIILNRNAQYFPHLSDYLTQAKSHLATKGRILLTGLAFFKDSGRKKVQVAKNRAEMADWGLTPLKAAKGYLDYQDRQALLAANIQLRSYWQLLPANLKAWWQPWRPRYAYGLYEDSLR